MASRVQTDIHTSMHTVIQTYLHSYRHTYMQAVGPEKSFKAGLGAMEIACSAMASPAKIDVTSKSPVGDMSVVTLIRTDATLDVYGCSSAMCTCMPWFPTFLSASSSS